MSLFHLALKIAGAASNFRRSARALMKVWFPLPRSAISLYGPAICPSWNASRTSGATHGKSQASIGSTASTRGTRFSRSAVRRRRVKWCAPSSARVLLLSRQRHYPLLTTGMEGSPVPMDGSITVPLRFGPYRITARSAATQTCRTSSHRPTPVAPGRYVPLL